MTDIIEALEEYKVQFSDTILLTEYLRKNPFDIAIDFREALEILATLANEKEKASILIACLKAKEAVEKNRSHKGGSRRNYENDLYEAFLQKYSGTVNLKKADILTLCSSFGGILLNGKECSIRNSGINTVITKIKDLNLDPELEIEALFELFDTDRDSAAAEILGGDDLHYEHYRGVFKKVKDEVKRNDNKWLELFSGITLNRNANDVEVENKLVYYQITGTIMQELVPGEEYNACVIEPSIFFIRKWINDAALSSVSTDFVVGNVFIRQFLQTIYNERLNVNFISYNDYFKSLSLGPADTTILFALRSETQESTEKILQKMYEASNKEHRLYILDADSSLLSLSSPVHQELSKFCIRKIDLLPQGIINASFPARKSFLYALFGYVDYDESELIAISKYALNNNTSNQVIYLQGAPVGISNRKFKDEDISLRKILTERYQKSLSTTGNLRKPAYRERFTEEIYIKYIVSEQPDKLFRTKAYAVLKDHGGDELSLNEDAALEKRNLQDKRNVTDFILKYPYAKKRLGDTKDKSIRNIVSNKGKEYFHDKSISLKTFLYIYPEFCDNYSDNLVYELNKLAETDLGDAELNRLNDSILTNALDRFYEYDDHKISINTMVSALSDIFDFAIQNGHCRFNPAQYIFIKHRDRFEELDEVNNAIGKRFLLISELRSIMNKCLKKITSGAFEYLSVILRLFTGLEANIISALKWKDFVPYETDDGETRYYLSTERQISRNGKSIEPLRRLEQSRHFPLIEPIAQLLLKRKEFLLASDTNFTIERLLETPIIPGSHQIDLLTSILPPQKINKLCLEMVKGLDIPDNYLPLPDNRYGLVEANLNAFKNDIYKNTFRHYLLRVRELSLGDIVFLLGTQAQNVDYKNYIDCMSNGNQERIEKALFKAWIICMEEKDE